MDKLGGYNWKIMKRMGKTFLLFQVIYKMVAIALIYPILIGLIYFALKITGVRYLTNGYILKVIANPIVIIIMVLLFLLFSLYIVYEMIFLSICYEYKRKGRVMTAFDIAKVSFNKLRKLGNRENIIRIPFALLLYAGMNIVVVFNLFFSGTLQNLWGALLIRYTWKVWIGVVCILLLIYIPIVMGYFSLYIFALEDKSLRDCYRKSFSITIKNLHRIISSIIVYNIKVILVIIFLYVMLSALLIAGVKILDMAYMGSAVFLSAMRIVRTGIKILLLIISVPFSYTTVTRLYYLVNKDRSTEKLPDGKLIVKSKNIFRYKVVYVIILTCSLLLNILYVAKSFNRNPFDHVAILSDIKITAHRGSQKKAPENTIAAFAKAIDDMADSIELDVQQTADGEIVVMHDQNVYRTTGVQKNIWDMTLAEVKQLDAGSHFSPLYEGEKIPTLDETIKFVKDKAKLNIEIKSNSHDTNIAQKVVDIIKNNNFANRCVVTSFDYNILKEVKQLDSGIEVGYILSAAYGNFYNMKDVDFFSVNAAFLSKLVVDSIHNAGKQVYAWTVNNSVSIKNLANKGVDTIITDDPIKAREVIYSRDTSETLINMIKYVFNN